MDSDQHNRPACCSPPTGLTRRKDQTSRHVPTRRQRRRRRVGRPHVLMSLRSAMVVSGLKTIGIHNPAFTGMSCRMGGLTVATEAFHPVWTPHPRRLSGQRECEREAVDRHHIRLGSRVPPPHASRHRRLQDSTHSVSHRAAHRTGASEAASRLRLPPPVSMQSCGCAGLTAFSSPSPTKLLRQAARLDTYERRVGGGGGGIKLLRQRRRLASRAIRPAPSARAPAAAAVNGGAARTHGPHAAGLHVDRDGRCCRRACHARG